MKNRKRNNEAELTAKDVADYMLQRLTEEETLYQEVIVYEIQEKFGEKFVYVNENGNLAISRKVLAAFRGITEGKVVWSRSDRFWRFREDFDDPDSRMIDY